MNRQIISTNGHQPELKSAIADLSRRFGDGAVMRLGDAKHLRVESISTGFTGLDQALGVGGLPRSRIVDIYGPEGTGKTTLCLRTIAQAQKQKGLLGAFIDTEHAMDPDHALKCGVDPHRLYVAQPDCGEQALEIAEEMVRSGVAVVVIDSAAALTPRAEIEGEMGESHAGRQSWLMSQALRKLAGPVRQSGSILIFTNQTRRKPDGVEVPTGGMALQFYASIRLELRRIRSIKQLGDVVGTRIRAVVKKNKVARPYQMAEFDIWYE